MNTKLTLKLDEDVIFAAKKYAKQKETSVSKLTENFLRNITASPSTEKNQISGVVAELSGILKQSELSDFKEDHISYLHEKYK